MLNFDDILLELSYKVPEGIVDLTKTHHLVELKRILKENGVDDPSPYLVVAEYYFGQLKSIEEAKSKNAVKDAAAKQGLEGKGGIAYGPVGKDIVTHLNKKGKLQKLKEPKKIEDKTKANNKDKKQSDDSQSVFVGVGSSVFPTDIKKTDGEENQEGTYDENNDLQRSIVDAKNEKQLMSALDELGEVEKDRMLKKAEAGPGGVVASTGETLCTESQTDIIQGRYDSEKVRESPKYTKRIDELKRIMQPTPEGKTDSKEKKKLKTELNKVCQKFGFFKENGETDYFAAMQVKAESDVYVQERLGNFKKTKAGSKFKDDEARQSWLQASFYASYSIMNNGPEDWNRETGNGRVLKANAITDGAVKKRLEEGRDNARTPKEKEHYEKQLKIWQKFKSYHDTYMVYTNDDGYTTVCHITNKKSDELDDPHNNTTPEKKLQTYMAAAREAGLSSKAVKVVGEAQEEALTATRSNDAPPKLSYTKIKDTKTIAMVADRLPARSQDDLKGDYYLSLKKDKLLVNKFKEKYGDNWQSAWKKAKPEEVIKMAMEVVNENKNDLQQLSGNFTKFILKVGQLAQNIFEKQKAGLSPKEIAAELGNAYSPKEIQEMLDSDDMKKMANIKAVHAGGLDRIHKNFIQNLYKADGHKPGHKEKNGPAVETYVAGTLKGLHIDTYVTNYDDNVIIEMGGFGCQPKDVRGCMAKLSRFKGETNTKEGREKLNKHLRETVRLDADSDAIYLLSDNGQERIYIATETWRQAGANNKKIASGFGEHLQECLKNSVGERLRKK